MYKRSENTFIEKIYIFLVLLKCGIMVNIFKGTIRYLEYTPRCYCKELKLMRHGKTIAVENNEFMSDNSENSVLSSNGKKEIASAIKKLNSFSPDVILVAPLKRTQETYNIIKKYIPAQAIEFEALRGINNSIWAGKTFETLDENDLFIFLNRECSHNIFIKTFDGDSWGDVLVRCVKVLQVINQKHKDKNVLLVSQGSIFQGLKIILHYAETPWKDYSATKMFNVKQYSGNTDYGKIYTIFRNKHF